MGAVLNLNTVFVCKYAVASACIAAKGLPTCVAETVANRSLSVYDTYDLPTARPGDTDGGGGGGEGGGGGGGGGGGSSNTLKTVLPVVLGGEGERGGSVAAGRSAAWAWGDQSVAWLGFVLGWTSRMQ